MLYFLKLRLTKGVSAAEHSLADDAISCDPPTEQEVVAAILWLKSGKAPGICYIPAELSKAGDSAIEKWITAVIRGVWEIWQIPPYWRKGIILSLYKGKGSRRKLKIKKVLLYF